MEQNAVENIPFMRLGGADKFPPFVEHHGAFRFPGEKIIDLILQKPVKKFTAELAERKDISVCPLNRLLFDKRLFFRRKAAKLGAFYKRMKFVIGRVISAALVIKIRFDTLRNMLCRCAFSRAGKPWDNGEWAM